MKTSLTLAATCLLLASPALAQSADPVAEPELPAAAEPVADTQADADAANFSDAEIGLYAEAAVEISTMQADTTLDAAARQSGAMAVLEESGLAPERFNAISAATRSDPAVAQRVQLAIANLRGEPGA